MNNKDYFASWDGIVDSSQWIVPDKYHNHLKSASMFITANLKIVITWLKWYLYIHEAWNTFRLSLDIENMDIN